MSIITMLLIVWAVLTTILIILIIYKGTLTMREDDQLFLDDSASHMEQEQKALLARVNKLTPFVNILGAGSAVLILVIAGIWVYRGLAGM